MGIQKAQPSVIWHKKGILAEIYAFVMQWVRLSDARVPSSMSALTVHVCHVPLKQRKWCCCFALAGFVTITATFKRQRCRCLSSTIPEAPVSFWILVWMCTPVNRSKLATWCSCGSTKCNWKSYRSPNLTLFFVVSMTVNGSRKLL